MGLLGFLVFVRVQGLRMYCSGAQCASFRRESHYPKGPKDPIIR